MEPFRDCAIDALSGTWRVRYTRSDGSCGTISDETVIIGAKDPTLARCTYAASNVSADKCRLEVDFTCPTIDGKGTDRWVGSLRQTGASHLEGSFTVQLNHPTAGVCRGTYFVTWDQQ